MKKEKLIPFISTILALAAAMLVYLNWNPEALLQGKEGPVSMEDIESGQVENFVGSKAGSDIPRLAGKDDFEKNRSLIFTAEPVGIISTGTYELKAWADPYYSNGGKRRTGAKKKKPQFRQYKNPNSILNDHADYLQIYLLELPDGSYILAQIPESAVRAIRSGKNITLPIGKKVSQGIPDKLKALCEEYDAYIGGIYYAFNDEWQEEHKFLISLLRIGVTMAVLFILAVVFIFIGNKLFRVKQESL